MSVETARQRLRDANPVPDPAALREHPVASTVFLAATEERSSQMRAEDQTITIRNARSSRPAWHAAIAALVVIVLGVASILVLRGGSRPFTADDAVAVADEYFAAFNAGDWDSLFALFTDDATFVKGFSDDLGSPVERAVWEQARIWDMAQGSNLTQPECTPATQQDATPADQPGATVAITCSHLMSDAVIDAVQSRSVPATMTVTVTQDGISEFSWKFGFPDFTETGFPFSNWLEANHPEVAEEAGCCEGATTEESVARGQLRAQYAAEWATFLEANGCRWAQPCEATESP